jgi:hypothetical protein
MLERLPDGFHDLTYSLIQFYTYTKNNLQEDQNTEGLPLLSVNTASSRLFDGTGLVERLVAYLCARTIEELAVGLEGAVTHISAEQVGLAVDAKKILRLAVIFCWWW